MGNKSATLKVMIDENLDTLSVLEGQINASLPTMCFSPSAFHIPCCLDVSGKEVGSVVCVTSSFSLYHVKIEMK